MKPSSGKQDKLQIGDIDDSENCLNESCLQPSRGIMFSCAAPSPDWLLNNLQLYPASAFSVMQVQNSGFFAASEAKKNLSDLPPPAKPHPDPTKRFESSFREKGAKGVSFENKSALLKAYTGWEAAWHVPKLTCFVWEPTLAGLLCLPCTGEGCTAEHRAGSHGILPAPGTAATSFVLQAPNVPKTYL